MAFFNGGSTRGLSTCGANAGGNLNRFDTGWGVASGSPSSLVLADASTLAFFNGVELRAVRVRRDRGGFFELFIDGVERGTRSPVAVGVP